jgi:UDP-glucose 4-epimerase
MAARVLLTGGTGYIGSHTYVALVEAGYHVVLLDDFSNSSPDVLNQLEIITGVPTRFHRADVSDANAIRPIFAAYDFDAVVHCAARKSVPQSLARPKMFFDANIASLLALMRVMAGHGVKTMVYSSSATVYGQPEALPIPEHAPLSYTSPYGLSKIMGEQFLNQQVRTSAGWVVGTLRYFNPAGAHPTALIGEAPVHDGGNLMPLIAKVARGVVPALDIYGHDYGTPDGTGIRDYVHVCDLAQGHVQSLDRLLRHRRSHTLNLGRGSGYSVLEVVKAYEAASGCRIPYRLLPRRPGYVAASFADPTMAARVIGFCATRDLHDMCRSSWTWETARQSDLQGALSSPPHRPLGLIAAAPSVIATPIARPS